MFTSQLRLSIQDLARLRIKDAYGVHRVVYDLFDPVRDIATPAGQNAASGILYADQGMKKEQRQILIVSDRSPGHATYGELQTREIPEQLFNFPAYRFEIIINPVKRDSNSGKLVPMRTCADVGAWFAAKTPGWGFELAEDQLEVHSVTAVQFAKKGHQVTLGQARLTGLLYVRDQECFTRSFKRGLGKGKAFGCGLLQIVPAV